MNNLSLQCLKLKKIQSNNYYGQFLIKSLKPGQGITLGNQLRRVLLGDLGGVAISSVRIGGIIHEFSTLPGVREDILEILLNLKGVILKSNSKKFQPGRLVAQGPKVVTADLIELPPELEIVNPEHYIATISTSDILEIEFKFEYGVGYKLANQSFLESDETFFQLDKVFMPVRAVDFKIENVYDTNNNVSEKLILDVWTNGSILPDEAIELGSKVTVDLFSSLTNQNQKTVNRIETTKQEIAPAEPYADIAIEELQLSIRPYNCLKRAQINTVADLLNYSPKNLLNLKNFGQKSAKEVFSALKLKLGIISN